MDKPTCPVPENGKPCGRPIRKRGWCTKHYQRWRAHGDPTFVLEIHGDDERRIRSKIKKTPAHWEWTGTIHRSTGYGCFRVPGHQLLAHRVVYELLVDPIPDGLTLDHIKERCGLKSCVKVLADEYGPAHLEPVTRGENTLRGDTITAANRAKTHCPYGHPYERAYGQRICRECLRKSKRESARRRYWRRKQEG